MQQPTLTRRALLGATSRLTAGISLLPYTPIAFADEAVFPHSGGANTVTAKVPANACDSHMHIYDERFPWAPGAKLLHPPATVAMYQKIQQRLGTTRCVVVTPSAYGIDNSCTLDALTQLGGNARGVAVVNSSVSDDELGRLDHAGVKGLRFNLALGSVTTIDMIAPLAQRVASLGWHLQINMSNQDVLKHQKLLSSLPVPVVFDHFARIPLDAWDGNPVYEFLRHQMKEGRAYVKLSGAYLASKVGAPGYDDAGALARALITAAPSQVVWGSDWPHPTESHKPNDALLLQLLGEWTGSDAARQAILVDNPARLYHF